MTITVPRIQMTVYGTPAPMGSKRAFVRGGRAILTDDNSEKRRNWANAVSARAAEVMHGLPVITRPVALRIKFYFQRPKSHFGTGKNAESLKGSAPVKHFQSPDLDKLVRCVGDALTGIVYRDDALIHTVWASRFWTTEQERAEMEIQID